MSQIDYYESYLIFKYSKETCLKSLIGGHWYAMDLEMIHIHISRKCEIRVDDKVVEKHRNKGIIFKILPTQNMSYLRYGRPNKWEDHVTIV